MIRDDNFLIKTFREHTPGVAADRKLCQNGKEVDDQNDTTFEYIEVNPGDEAGWLFWTENTRVQGAWSQAVPAILDEETGLIPIQDKTLVPDTTFAYKTESSSVGDVTKFRVVKQEDFESGQPGILLQCLNQDSHEQLFFPVGEGAIKVDWKSGGNESTKIYDVKADGTIDTSNYGTTKDLWYVDTSRAYIHTAARFRYDATKKGGLDFASTAIPTAGAGETLYNVRPYFDIASGLWKWYVTITDGTGIVADNTNSLDSSTYIYGAVVGGGADPANKGSCKEVFYIESNFPYIKTGSKFRLDATNKGALDFKSSSPPAPSSGQTLYQPTLHFNSGTGLWEWYVVVEDESAGAFCRVAWNFSEEQDLSEGEIVTFDSNTEEWSGSGTKIWIDWKRSKSIKFETAGTDTIFECQIVVPDYVRSNQTRDLYRLINCVDDNGYTITHIEKTGVDPYKISGYLLSEDIASFPWLSPTATRIKTEIDNVEKDNKMQSRIAKEWNTQEQNWNFVEVNDISKSLPWYFSPLKPIMLDPDESTYESYYQDGLSRTIATYKRF